MNYKIYGPFKIPRESEGLISRDAKTRRAFWADIDERMEGLSGACGCYILTIRNKAWYVGMAEKQSFKMECFQPHKIVQYDLAIGKGKGVPHLIFLAKITPSEYFSVPSKRGHSDIRQLEQLLIGSAINRNPQLCNIRNTKTLREIIVPGFLNTKKGQSNSNSVKEFKKAIGV